RHVRGPSARRPGADRRPWVADGVATGGEPPPVVAHDRRALRVAGPGVQPELAHERTRPDVVGADPAAAQVEGVPLVVNGLHPAAQPATCLDHHWGTARGEETRR